MISIGLSSTCKGSQGFAESSYACWQLSRLTHHSLRIGEAIERDVLRALGRSEVDALLVNLSFHVSGTQSADSDILLQLLQRQSDCVLLIANAHDGEFAYAKYADLISEVYDGYLIFVSSNLIPVITRNPIYHKEAVLLHYADSLVGVTKAYCIRL